MSRDLYCYTFGDKAPVAGVRDALLLAVYLTEELHGRASVRLDSWYCLDEETRTCAIDAATPVGQTISRLFTALLVRQLGEDGFEVEHLVEPRPAALPVGGEQR